MKRASLLLLCGVWACGDAGLLGRVPDEPQMPVLPDPGVEPSPVAPVQVEPLPDQARPIPEGQIIPAEPYGPLPIVLVHGFLASGSLWSFTRIHADLVAAGYPAYMAIVASVATPEERATYVAARIDEVLAETGAPKVQLVAHSMGGLDCRVAISGLGYGDRVDTLTTVSTPHRGSHFADEVLLLSGNAPAPLVEAVTRIFGRAIGDVDTDPDFRAAIESLTPAELVTFNQSYPDDRRVTYRSYAGLSSILGRAGPDDMDACGTLFGDPNVRDLLEPIMLPVEPFTAEGLRRLPNDGMVPVASAQWGEFRGCIHGDHADEVGEFDDVVPDPRTGFDVFAFYRDLAAELSLR